MLQLSDLIHSCAEAPGASSSTVASEANTLTTKSHSSSREEKLPRRQVTGGYLAYYHDLLFYKGAMTAEELLSASEDRSYRLETVGFGVANWYLVQGLASAA